MITLHCEGCGREQEFPEGTLAQGMPLELARRTGGSEASVSARLRDLRKERFGSWEVIRERVSGGLYRYRLGKRLQS